MFLNNLLIFSSLGAIGLVFISNDWRMRIAGLTALYIISFIVIVQIWPIALASVKLISGLMSIALLSASRLNVADQPKKVYYASQTAFRLFMAVLFWIVIAALAPSINDWIPIPYTNLYIGLSLLANGLIFISLVNTFFDKIIGLLVMLIGFDIIYSSLEGSALVTGILGFIIILIGLLSGYFTKSESVGDVE